MNWKLDKCHCSKPGFCPVFNKTMGEEPANWKWCQNASPEKRKNYYTSCASVKNSTKKYKTIPDMDRVQVACLGHCSSQFEQITKKDYLKFLYLQNLNLGKYKKFQNNQYSETRGYLADIFDYENKDYVGVVTASWNKKYLNKNKIDRLEKWIDIDLLDNGNVLCATVASTETWVEGEGSVMKWLGTSDFHKNEILKFHENIGMTISDRQVANHNQIICHKNIFIELENHFKNNIFEYSKLFDKFNLSDFSEFSRKRLFGFFCEFSTMMFLDNMDYKCIPMQTCNNSEWFKPEKIQKRDNGVY